MSYGSDYLREAMTLNERNGNNKKRLIEKINHENDEINDLLRKASDTSYKLTDKDAILNKHGVQARESIEDKQHPLKEDFTEELRSDIQYEIHYSIKDALDNILVNLIDDINREFPEYNLNLNRIDTEQYAVELSEIIMKDLFPNM